MLGYLALHCIWHDVTWHDMSCHMHIYTHTVCIYIHTVYIYISVCVSLYVNCQWGRWLLRLTKKSTNCCQVTQRSSPRYPAGHEQWTRLTWNQLHMDLPSLQLPQARPDLKHLVVLQLHHLSFLMRNLRWKSQGSGWDAFMKIHSAMWLRSSS